MDDWCEVLRLTEESAKFLQRLRKVHHANPPHIDQITATDALIDNLVARNNAIGTITLRILSSDYFDTEKLRGRNTQKATKTEEQPSSAQEANKTEEEGEEMNKKKKKKKKKVCTPCREATNETDKKTTPEEKAD